MLNKFVFRMLALVTLLAAVAVWQNGCSKDKPTSPNTACLDSIGNPLPVAPDSERVDLYMPVFSDPLNVSNPLFPIKTQHSVVMLGLSDGEPFRTEVTLLPNAKTITINGQPVQTLESQYVAFLGGRIHEVALDWYAQDNLGAVWYLGEDVFNYEEGVIADSNGTWLAGEEGPAAMIMPASPVVGDVYRPENACPIVFEEVVVDSTGVTVNGPSGPVAGAIVVEELHMDGSREAKTFAPGYGEFSTGSGNNIEAVALVVPTDALSGSTPAELVTITAETDTIFDAAETGDWGKANVSLNQINSAWTTYQSAQIPPRLGAQMNDALAALAASIAAHASEDIRQSAIDVARAAFDFRLRYQLPAEIDIARFELWARQVLVDAGADDTSGVKGDAAILEWTRDRFIHTVDASIASQINTKLSTLRANADAEDLAAAEVTAAELRVIIKGIM